MYRRKTNRFLHEIQSSRYRTELALSRACLQTNVDSGVAKDTITNDALLNVRDGKENRKEMSGRV
jgi:hypothetical protein